MCSAKPFYVACESLQGYYYINPNSHEKSLQPNHIVPRKQHQKRFQTAS